MDYKYPHQGFFQIFFWTQMEKSIARKTGKQPAWGDPCFPDFLVFESHK
jgi:hypothetical protein